MKKGSQLFDLGGSGARELELLTGLWYASSPFRLIEGEIVQAEREVRGLVGSALFERAAAVYQSGGGEGEPAPPWRGEAGASAWESYYAMLTDALRLPVALLAIARYSRQTDISHEATGRKAKMDDNERSPFQWQIDRDDRELRERYYRSLDALYELLEEGADPDWERARELQGFGESIVRDIRQLEAVYPVDGSRYVFYRLLPLVIERQRSDLEPRCGGKWADIAAGTAPERVLALARRAAVLGAVITAARRWSLEVFPLEIARRFSPTYQGDRANKAALIEEIDWHAGLLDRERKDALDALAELLAEGPAGAARAEPENCRRNKYFTTE